MYNALRARPGRPEDDYFRVKDAELIARARAAYRIQHPELTDPHPERRALGNAIGSHDFDIVAPLHEAGLRAATIDLLESIPAIEVAWVDDVDPAEREELRRQFIAYHGENPAGMALLTEWLFVRPPERFLHAARLALQARLRRMSPDARQAVLDRILGRCLDVGRASGGLLGLGALSGAERRRIRLVEQDLDQA